MPVLAQLADPVRWLTRWRHYSHVQTFGSKSRVPVMGVPNWRKWGCGLPWVLYNKYRIPALSADTTFLLVPAECGCDNRWPRSTGHHCDNPATEQASVRRRKPSRILLKQKKAARFLSQPGSW